MAAGADTWYVRLPDGRTLRARNAEVLRGYLIAGRIPWDSSVRRSGDEQWRPLDHVAEFAVASSGEESGFSSTAAPAPGSSGSRSGELRAFGVRNLVEELLSAFDRSLSHVKLGVGAMTGVLFAIGVIALELVGGFPFGVGAVIGYTATALFLLASVALGTVLLTQMTFIELDRHRPALAAEVRAGLLRQTLRVLVAQSLVAALLVGLVLLFRVAGPWLAARDFGEHLGVRDLVVGVLSVLRLLLEVLCWPILGMAVLLLGPLLVIEEHSILRSLSEWLGMLRRHLGRIYLYEALALTMATVLALPMLLLVAVAAYSVGDAMTLVERIALLVLGGVALAPMIAYLTTANVFIYLNIRYEFFYTSRN
jgi:hypothetical protein